MNYFRASAKSLRMANMTGRVLVLVLAPFVPWSFQMAAIAFGMYLFYYMFASQIMLHKYYSHKVFEFRFKIVKYLFDFIVLSSLRGSPLGWTYVHRQHHRFADTLEDPHTIYYDEHWNMFQMNDVNNTSEKISPFVVRDLLTSYHKRLNEYYWLYSLIVPIILLAISLQAFYFFWLLPIILFQFITNYSVRLAHLENVFTYTNFKDKDKSVNNPILFPFILGECWHNNHHHNPKELHTGGKHWWEFDPSYYIIKLL